MGAGLAGMLALTLYTAMGQSFAIVNVTRENLRATQILVEKLEVIRLVKWEDLETPGFVPLSTTEYYDPSASAGPCDSPTGIRGPAQGGLRDAAKPPDAAAGRAGRR